MRLIRSLMGTLLALVPVTLAAQAPDSVCLVRARVATDSLAKRHLTSVKLTQYQERNLRVLDSLHTARCVLTAPDTAHHTPPPDSTPPSPVAVSLTLTATDTLVRAYPALPFNAFVSVRYDSAGTVRDTAIVVVRPALARLGYERSRRAWTVYSPTASGALWVVATRSGVTDSLRLQVIADTTPLPPPPPPPPPAPPIVVTRTGWAATIDSLVGPIPDCAAVKASTNATVRLWLSNFEKWEAAHWRTDSSAWAAANYYDRGKIEYVFAACYARSDSARAAMHLARGHAIVLDYRDQYLAKWDGAVPQHQQQLEGVALHALLTGDTLSRRLIGRTAENALGNYYRNRVFGQTLHVDMENRIAAYTVRAVGLARVLQSPGKSITLPEWPRKLDSLWVMIYRAQKPNGQWCYRCGPPVDTVKLTFPYMDAILVDASLMYGRWYPNGPQLARLAQLRRSTYDFLLDSALRADSSFHYNVTPATVTPSMTGGRTASPDLNGFHPANLWALWRETGDPKYRDAAALLFDKGVRSGFYAGTKQFNQAYAFSYRYVAQLLASTP